MHRMWTIVVLAGWVASAAVPALADSAERARESFAAGQALLAKADFDGALQAFATAARADSANQQYLQQHAMLRQVMLMRKACAQETDNERWLQMAGALRAYYYDHDLPAEALPLDQERQRRAPSADSAVLLAETQLELGMNSEVVEVLDGLSAEQRPPRSSVLRGIALAGLGYMDEARELASFTPLVMDDADAALLCDVARLRALTGDSMGACAALTRCLEQTPPSRLAVARQRVKSRREFATLQTSTAFIGALATASKVKESKCSTGADCGKCPKQTKCAKSAKPDAQGP